jgi:hypothetical protein
MTRRPRPADSIRPRVRLRAIWRKSAKIRESQNAVVSFLLFFGIAPFQWVVGDSKIFFLERVAVRQFSEARWRGTPNVIAASATPRALCAWRSIAED